MARAPIQSAGASLEGARFNRNIKPMIAIPTDHRPAPAG